MSPSNAARDARPEPDSYLVGRWFAAARRQGLLAAVPPEAWHTLSALLSFTCRDGRRLFTTDQLALSLALPRPEALRRLAALEGSQWQGQPLATVQRDPSGEVEGAVLTPTDLLLRVLPPPAAPVLLPLPAVISLPAPAGGAPPEALDPGGALATEGPAPAASPDLTAALLAVGLTAEQAERLLTDFAAERVRRQLAWLPHRSARNPAAFLVRAVEGDWAGPKEDA